VVPHFQWTFAEKLVLTFILPIPREPLSTLIRSPEDFLRNQAMAWDAFWEGFVTIGRVL